MKIMKTPRISAAKLCSLLLAVFVLAGILPQTAFADSRRLEFTAKTSGTGNSIQVKRVSLDYEDGVPEFEVDFISRVTWKSSAKVTVKDNKGKSYRAFLASRDSDDCDISVPSLKEGRTYTIVINGIKRRGTSGYRKLTIKAKVPAQKTGKSNVKVAKVTVDEDKSEIDVKFTTKVLWKSGAKVTSIKDNKGKTYKGYLAEMDDDDCEIYVENLKYDRTYTIKISGIKAVGSGSYGTVTITAKVPARKNNLYVRKAEYDEDYDDGRTEYTVTFEFNKDIAFEYGKSYVIVRDQNGSAYSSSSSYVDWDDDECEVHLSRPLTVGTTYTYEIVHVKPVNSGSYGTLKGSFVAYYD